MNTEHSGSKKAVGSRERRFVMWASVVCLVYVASFLAVLFLFPQTRPGIFVPYAIILAVGIAYWNRRQSAIRREEQPDA
jgi:L-asparagine transporter-like permease